MTTTLKELIAEVKQEAEKLPFYTRLPASAQASTLFFLEQMATRAYSLGEVEGRKEKTTKGMWYAIKSSTHETIDKDESLIALDARVGEREDIFFSKSEFVPKNLTNK